MRCLAFSGNRQWGWLINENGNFEIYTRAVDVAKVDAKFLSDFATKVLGSNLECQQETYYDIAEATWQNMQQEVADWINNQDNSNNSGQATIKDTKAVHIKNEKIIEILCAEESEGTIEDLLNNCN